ncbi:PadR family transcriptional regulator [Propioniciclava coleopterorum]|uniref:PadR family transcriptional regulator n=1 Tax=Propioniciclava coleopterorum TaxID=2714937 RepID=A0A6G7Y645_9ACTN|nr:PadR family transcriptional regulator [Propioniciclava coleopterorum]QIK72270.1 PadR family transcriptional regulator [Propioniciclava coleopterorum]
MISDRWPAEWLRGLLQASVLAIIADGETYGYVIAQRLDDAGLGRIKGGTLYPLLGRLEEGGLVTSAWREGNGGPGRKFFTITAAGRRELDRLRADWAAFTAITSELIGAPREP